MTIFIEFTALAISTGALGTTLNAKSLPVFGASIKAPSDSQYCRRMRDNPTKDVSVLCPYRTVIWSQSLDIDESKMPKGWFAIKQAEWDKRICSDPAQRALSRRGWRFVQSISFKSGNSFTMDATCSR